MPENTADIIGTTGSSFTITLDSAKIVGARLVVDGKDDVDLTISGSKREVTVNSLPSGDSKVALDLFWKPDEDDATIDLGKVISGSANAPSPKQTIDAGETPGFVLLFGKGSK